MTKRQQIITDDSVWQYTDSYPPCLENAVSGSFPADLKYEDDLMIDRFVTGDICEKRMKLM